MISCSHGQIGQAARRMRIAPEARWRMLESRSPSPKGRTRWRRKEQHAEREKVRARIVADIEPFRRHIGGGAVGAELFLEEVRQLPWKARPKSSSTSPAGRAEHDVDGLISWWTTCWR